MPHKTVKTNPSRPLTNRRHEAFVMDVVGGMKASDAYRKHYLTTRMKDQTIHKNASKLHTQVLPRIEHLRSVQIPKKKGTRDACKKVRAKRKTRPKSNGKHPGGRPPLYDDPKTMLKKGNRYFVQCDKRLKRVSINDGGKANAAVDPEPYTISGLTYFLGFSDRQALREYETKPEFSLIIKRMKLRVQVDVERRLFEGRNATGAIFWLKNNARDDYKDRSEYEHTGKDGKDLPSVQVVIAGKSKQAL